MKNKLSGDGTRPRAIMRRLAICIGVLAIIGLALSAREYLVVRRQIARLEKASLMMDKLMAVEQIMGIMDSLGDGHVKAATERLDSQLASNLAYIASGLSADDTATKKFMATIRNQVARNKKAHPDYYLNLAARQRLAKPGIRQIVNAEPIKPGNIAVKSAGEAVLLSVGKNN